MFRDGLNEIRIGTFKTLQIMCMARGRMPLLYMCQSFNTTKNTHLCDTNCFLSVSSVARSRTKSVPHLKSYEL